MPLQLGRSLEIVSGPPEQGILRSTAGVWVPPRHPIGGPGPPPDPGEETEAQEADGRDQSRLCVCTWGGHH